MSFEAIKGISDAETLGKAKVAEAEAKVKQMLADAEESGRAALDAANSRAETELKALRERPINRQRRKLLHWSGKCSPMPSS